MADYSRAQPCHSYLKVSRRPKVVQVTGSARGRSYYCFGAAAKTFACQALFMPQIGLTWAQASTSNRDALSGGRLWLEYLEMPRSNQP